MLLRVILTAGVVSSAAPMPTQTQCLQEQLVALSRASASCVDGEAQKMASSAESAEAISTAASYRCEQTTGLLMAYEDRCRGQGIRRVFETKWRTMLIARGISKVIEVRSSRR